MIPENEVPGAADTGRWRVRLAKALADHIEEDKKTWGDMDDLLIARYLSGKCTKAEKARVKSAMEQYPYVEKWVKLAGRAEPALPIRRLAIAATILAIATFGYFVTHRPQQPQVASLDPKANDLARLSPLEAVASLERQAEALRDAPPQSPQVLALRLKFASSPMELAALAWHSEKIVRFMAETSRQSSEQLTAELGAKVAGISRASDDLRPRRTTDQAMYVNAVYEDVRLLPSQTGGHIPPRLVDFLLDERPRLQVGMIVPYFFHTMDETDRLSWDRIVALAGKDLPLKIVNTRQYTEELTAGSDFVRAFGDAIDFADKRNVEVYAYVNCSGGGKSLKIVQEEVRKWHEFYGKRLGGIYFDNQAMFNDGRVEFFRQLFAFTSELEKDWKIISATDNECDESYGKIRTDSIICYKTNGSFPKFKGWEKAYDSGRFGAMIFNVPQLAEPEFKKVAAVFGWVFVAGQPETAYKSLPDYLEQEAASLKKLNAREPAKGQDLKAPPSSGTDA